MSHTFQLFYKQGDISALFDGKWSFCALQSLPLPLVFLFKFMWPYHGPTAIHLSVIFVIVCPITSTFASIHSLITLHILRCVRANVLIFMQVFVNDMNTWLAIQVHLCPLSFPEFVTMMTSKWIGKRYINCTGSDYVKDWASTLFQRWGLPSFVKASDFAGTSKNGDHAHYCTGERRIFIPYSCGSK